MTLFCISPTFCSFWWYERYWLICLVNHTVLINRLRRKSRIASASDHLHMGRWPSAWSRLEFMWRSSYQNWSGCGWLELKTPVMKLGIIPYLVWGRWFCMVGTRSSGLNRFYWKKRRFDDISTDSLYPNILQALSTAVSKESHSGTLDNICGAICKMIITNTAAVPLDHVSAFSFFASNIWFDRNRSSRFFCNIYHCEMIIKKTKLW